MLGNLSRDQLDRYGEVHAVGDAWRAVAEAHPELAIVANASDPHVVWAATPGRVTWVELGLAWRQDAATCPSCGALLTWSADRFDCPACGFTQPEAAHRLEGETVVLDGHRAQLRLALPGAWNSQNAALALVAATTHFGIDAAVAAEAMARVTTVAGRFMAVPLGDGRHATVLLSKNPAGWAEALRHVAHRSGAGVTIAVNAHVADGKDPSWLWDVPYEWLRDHPVAAVRRARARRRGPPPVRGTRRGDRRRPGQRRALAPRRRGVHHRLVHAVLGALSPVRTRSRGQCRMTDRAPR